MCMYILRHRLPNFKTGIVGCSCWLSQDGTTPLFMACQNGHETVVKLLLDGGSDVNKAMVVSKILWLLGKSESKCPKCAYSEE